MCIVHWIDQIIRYTKKKNPISTSILMSFSSGGFSSPVYFVIVSSLPSFLLFLRSFLLFLRSFLLFFRSFVSSLPSFVRFFSSFVRSFLLFLPSFVSSLPSFHLLGVVFLRRPITCWSRFDPAVGWQRRMIRGKKRFRIVSVQAIFVCRALSMDWAGWPWQTWSGWKGFWTVPQSFAGRRKSFGSSA